MILLFSTTGHLWKAASQKLGKMLVVEKGFRFEAEHSFSISHIRRLDKENAALFYIKDAVEDIFKKVLLSGESNEFLDDGMIKEYDHIDFVKYHE